MAAARGVAGAAGGGPGAAAGSLRDVLERRAPEVGWNGAVLHRELRGLGFTGGYLQIQRYLQPLRAAQQWAAVATVRFETRPGEQAQIDFGQLRLWIADALAVAHLFVFTLGYSRRQWARAYPHERLDVLLDGHERAFRHFGGVPLSCLYDNPRTQVLGRREGRVRARSATCLNSSATRRRAARH